MVPGRTRYEGYVAGLAAAGLEVDDAARRARRLQPGQRRVRRCACCCRGGPDLDAVFCANDLMAAGALRALREAGRRVPEDVAVVGFDDAPIAQSTHPPLTTVHQSPEEMGREMVALLLEATPYARTSRPRPDAADPPGRPRQQLSL